MQILQPHAHGSHIDSQVFELAEQIVQVMRRQGELGGLEVLGGEANVRPREGLREADRGGRGGGCASCGMLVAMLGTLRLQRIRKGSFMCADKVG